MLEYYKDVLELTDKPPVWWTQHGYPRWCEATSDNCSNVYADRLAFMEIGCQQCDRRFLVELCFTRYDRLSRDNKEFVEIDPTKLHYGDPPNVNCCSAGATMNSCPRMLVAAYKREKSEWELTHENIPVRAEWDNEADWNNDPKIESLFTSDDPVADKVKSPSKNS